MSLQESYHSLPWEKRRKILEQLRTGTPSGVTLTPRDLAAIRRTKEYKEYLARTEADRQSRSAEKITSAVLHHNEDLGEITDSARYELAKLVRSLIADASGDPELSERIKAVRSLSQSLAALSNPALEKRIALKNTELKTMQKVLQEKEQEISRLKELARAGETGQVIESMNKQVGLV